MVQIDRNKRIFTNFKAEGNLKEHLIYIGRIEVSIVSSQESMIYIISTQGRNKKQKSIGGSRAAIDFEFYRGEPDPFLYVCMTAWQPKSSGRFTYNEYTRKLIHTSRSMIGMQKTCITAACTKADSFIRISCKTMLPSNPNLTLRSFNLFSRIMDFRIKKSQQHPINLVVIM